MSGGESSTNGVKFAQYTQPGGEGYTELVFTLPKDYSVANIPGPECG